MSRPYIMYVIGAIAMFTALYQAPATAIARPSMTVDETAEAVYFYQRSDPVALRDALRSYDIQLSNTGGSISTRRVTRVTDALPSDFSEIENINRESSSHRYNDRDEAYEDAAYAVSVPFTDPDYRDEIRGADRFCDKHFRRIGQRQAFSECVYRYLVTHVRFARDKERCARDARYMLPDAPTSDIEREEYRCVRRAGWRDPAGFIANIDLPNTLLQ